MNLKTAVLLLNDALVELLAVGDLESERTVLYVRRCDKAKKAARSAVRRTRRVVTLARVDSEE